MSRRRLFNFARITVLFYFAVLTTTASTTTLNDAIERIAEDGCSGALPMLRSVAAASERAAAARALLYLGYCMERLGQNEAWREYEKVSLDFADQPQPAAAARARLAKLGHKVVVQKQVPILRCIGEVGLPLSGDRAFAPDPSEIWVSHHNADTVSVVDGPRLRLKRTIKVGHQPAAMGASPDGRTIYVALNGGGISAIQKTSGEVTFIPTGGMVTDLAVGANTGEVFFTMCTKGVRSFDPRTGAVRSLYAGYCPWHLATTPDGGTLYVAFQSGGPGGSRGHDAIGRFNTRSRKLERSITGLPNVGCKTAISPDGRWLWETACDACLSRSFDRVGCPAVPAGALHVFDLRSEKLVRTLTFPGIAPQFIAFSPDSRLVAVTSSSGIILYDTDRLDVIAQLTDRACSDVVFAPGRSRLFAVCGKALRAYDVQ